MLSLCYRCVIAVLSLCYAFLHLIAANIFFLVGDINEQESFACYLSALLGLLYYVKHGLRDSFAGV